MIDFSGAIIAFMKEIVFTLEVCMKKFIKQYRHAWILFAYACLYIPWFVYLEKTVTKNYHVIHMAVDDYIPFNEYFIIPYFLWFAYVAGAVAYFLFTDKGDYYKLCTFLFSGMTIFLIVSTVFPNGHHLRPLFFENDNLFTRMTASLYKTDTSTNLFPSIHVYNSIGVQIAVMNSRRLTDCKWVRRTSFVLCTSIILSTVFLKQHSVFDVITAFIMAAAFYLIVYGIDYESIAAKRRRKQLNPEHNI